jgi:signal transduction histidine kinase
MNVHSIKFKITTILTLLIATLVIVLFAMNSFLAEGYYLKAKRKQMLVGYDKINELVSSYEAGTITKTQMEDSLEYYTTSNSMSVLVVNSDWTTMYTNSAGEAEMLVRLKRNIFNNDIFDYPANDENVQDNKLDKQGVTPNDDNIDTSQDGVDATKKNPDGRDKNFDKIYDMYNGGIEENRDILVETDKYTLQKVYDDRMLDYYYELWGTLDNGSSFIMRISIQGIKDNVKIFNSFIPLVGCIIIILGVVAAFVMSSYISRPITEIAGIAEKMAELNFDVKYTGNDKGEIGALGESINNMSEKLEKNISQLKAANLSLQKDIAKKEEIEQMRSGFLSNVSHELKTPIALIQGYAEGLKDGITDDPESMDFYCDVIIDEANKMNNMVKRLLTLNQIEYGQDELVIERFDLMELLNSVVNANELRAGQKDISIEFVRKDDKLDVWADEYKTEEVITNYISNAINHCDYDKKIRVYYEKRPDTVRVFVYNTGKHIPDEDIENIWVKFYKVDKARTREYGGNGIGLSIVKAIMDTYGKECGVDNVDGGVTFWFDLDAKA